MALGSAQDIASAAGAYFNGAPSNDAVPFHDISLPPRAFSRTDRIPDLLIAAIDATLSTARLGLYELNLPGVADAIVRAKARGVDVKLIYDHGHGTGTAQETNPIGDQASGPSAEFKKLLDAGVEARLLRGGGKFGIMHNKTAILDDQLVETGSFNWSVSADQLNFENALFRNDPSLAELYTSYWNWMWGLAQPVDAAPPQQGQEPAAGFGAPPSDPSPSVIFKDQNWPRASFSPLGGTEAQLIKAISLCTKTLDIAIFSLYSEAIAGAIAAAKDLGLAVRVVADVSQARRSPAVAALLKRGIDLRLSSGRGGLGVLHHKFSLLDHEMLDTGSYNFSFNAENDNFENQFHTTDTGDLAAYQTEFEAVWDQAHVPAMNEVEGPAEPAPALAGH